MSVKIMSDNKCCRCVDLWLAARPNSYTVQPWLYMLYIMSKHDDSLIFYLIYKSSKYVFKVATDDCLASTFFSENFFCV